MSGRRDRRSNGNNIRGPQSALTDFLASHNISAQQISIDYQRRVEEAQRQAAQQAAQEATAEAPSDEDEDPVERKKRKRKEEMAIMKIKQSKEFKRRKYEAEDEEDDDTLVRQMLKKAQPLPGQLENCEECQKRFTVTPYCKNGPGGGLLCMKCSKALKIDEKKAQAQEKKVVPRIKRRQTESDRMMGDVSPGAKSLKEHCMLRISNVFQIIEELGELPQNMLDRLSQILSKDRIVTSRTLPLLLRPGVDRLAIYDSGKLETEDFEQIFTLMPDLEIVDLRFAGQMKDVALLYMVEKTHHLRSLQLGAVNLISNEAWSELFKKRGSQLESLKLSELNDSLNDESVAELAEHCTKLRRLKLRSCSKITEASIESISKLSTLEHISLAVGQESSVELLVAMIESIGSNLKTLSLENYLDADDTVLQAIRDNCKKLTKLRFTGNNLCTDQAFSDLFQSSVGGQPLHFADLSANRNIDHANPDGSRKDDTVGLGSAGFKALMSHSGTTLEELDLHSCRHIPHEAFIEVFDGKKQYNKLKIMDLSFCTHVDEIVMNGIFKSCPKLHKLAVFACFNARGAEIPSGIAVVGLPNAKESIVINGDAMIDI